MVKRQRLINTFIELIKINSPSFREREISEFIAQQLKSCSFDVLLQDYGQSLNIIARKEGVDKGAPTLILNAHMDTVEDTEKIEFAISDGRIRSIGPTVLGSDDKSGIAQIIEALRVIQETGAAHGTIEVVLTSAEEKGLVGVKNLDFSLLQGRHALVLDSSGPVGNLIVGAPTHITYTMTVTGKAAHAGIEPERGINSIRVASEIVTNIADGRIDDSTTANIGIISGGSATNIVPPKTTLKGEVRSHNSEKLRILKGEIFNQAELIAKKYSALLNIQENIEYESFSIKEGDSFLGLICEAYRNCGITPQLCITGGGSDANIFNKRGIKAINLSNGMQAVHSSEEFILIEDLLRGTEIVIAAIKKMPGAVL